MSNLTVDILRETIESLSSVSPPKERLIVTYQHVINEMLKLNIPLEKIPGRRAYIYLGTTFLISDHLPEDFSYCVEKI